MTRDKSNCVLHDDIYEAIVKRPRQIAIIAPRGHAKTSVASTIGTVYDIAFDREEFIILIKKTFPQAVTDLAAVVDNIKYNDRFQAFFGNREFLIDRQEKAYILNPYTGHKTYIETKGSNQPIRGARTPDGRRPTKVLMDDFEDEKNVLTPEQREKLRQYVTGQILPAMEPSKSHVIAIGTIVHYDSWLNNLWENYQAARKEGREYSWEVIFHQMIEDDKPIWPERFTPEYIEKLRASYEEQGRLGDYYQEYMNIPFNIDNADFRRDYVQYWEGHFEYNGHENYVVVDGESKPIDLVIGIDPSSGTSGDYTGIVVLGITKDGRRYLDQATRQMIKPDELKEKVFELWNKYHPRLIVMEEQAMQVIMGYWLREEMIKRNTYIPILGEKVSTRVAKEDKLRQALQPIYSSGVMRHKRHMVHLEEELFTFPKGKHDDILDALYLASKYARKASSDTVTDRTKKIFRSGYDWLTGARHGNSTGRKQTVAIY